MSKIDDAKDVINAAEAVTETAEAAAATKDAVTAAASGSINVEKAVDTLNKIGDGYQNMSRHRAGNVLDRFINGCKELFTGGKEIAKKLEEGGGPKILP